MALAKKEEETKTVEEPKTETPVEETTETPTEAAVEETPVAVEDTAIEQSKADYSSATSEPAEVDDSAESAKKIEAHAEVQEAIFDGSVAGLTASQVSVASQPLVADPVTGKPVYPTAEAAFLAQQVAGKLGTPAPTED